jgi:murein L,D-transpeptidase YcbB/YkuD
MIKLLRGHGGRPRVPYPCLIVLSATLLAAILLPIEPARADDVPLWSREGALSPQAVALVKLLGDVAADGLDPDDYDAGNIASDAARLRPASAPADWAAFDAHLTRAATRLIGDLHYGRVDPRAAGFELPEPRRDLDVAASVATLAQSADVPKTMAAFEPQFLHYALLKSALARYRQLALDHAELTQLPPVPRRRKPLRDGDAYAGVEALTRLLLAEGDLPGIDPAGPGGVPPAPSVPAAAPAPVQTLTPALGTALRHYQERHGLAADAALNAATYAALTTPFAARVQQIELTLERWRWLPPFESPPIIVNIPEFRLFAFSTTADRVASILQMPVIVGQAFNSKETPVFVGRMQTVVFRPYWDVPRSITRKEMLPKLRANPAYLAKNHLEIVAGEGDDGKVLAPSATTIAALATGDLRLRQLPGPDNSLGLVKFLFPNAHNVYLHSTPARALFLASRRAFSHGCIRVSDPEALAAFVLQDADGNWDRAAIEAAMQQGDNRRIALRRPIPVMILYGTAMATEAGSVQFFDDIYGHDAKLAKLLKARLVPGRATNR